MSRITSGRVITRFSLQPSRCGPPKSAAVRWRDWMAVPIAPSRTSIRSANTSSNILMRSCLSVIPTLQEPANFCAASVRDYHYRTVNRLERRKARLLGAHRVLVADVLVFIDKECADRQRFVGQEQVLIYLVAICQVLDTDEIIDIKLQEFFPAVADDDNFDLAFFIGIARYDHVGLAFRLIHRGAKSLQVMSNCFHGCESCRG